MAVWAARVAPGGTGGTGGLGGTSTGAKGGNGTAGSAGSAGAAGADGSPSLPTTNAEPASVVINRVFVQPIEPTPVEPVTPTYTLSLNAGPGSCSVSSLSGTAGSWANLPTPSMCSYSGHTLGGWVPSWTTEVFPPGAPVNLTGDNSLTALWATGGATPSATPTPGPSSSTGALTVFRVIWLANGRSVREGDPDSLVGRHAVFTIATTRPSDVSAATVAAAKALAAEYDGTYGGIVRADTWRAPRIVAAYMA